MQMHLKVENGRNVHTLEHRNDMEHVSYMMLRTKTMHVWALHAEFCFDAILASKTWEYRSVLLPHTSCIMHIWCSRVTHLHIYTIHIIIKHSIEWLDERMVILDIIVNHKRVWSFVVVVVDFFENFLYLIRYTNRLKRYLEHRFYLLSMLIIILNPLASGKFVECEWHTSFYKFKLWKCFMSCIQSIGHCSYYFFSAREYHPVERKW